MVIKEVSEVGEVFISWSECWLHGCVRLAKMYRAVHLDLCIYYVYPMLQYKTSPDLSIILNPYTKTSTISDSSSLQDFLFLNFSEQKWTADFMSGQHMV